MNKRFGLIVLAGSLAFGALAAAQVPAPPPPPAGIAAPALVPAAPPAPPAPPAPAVAAPDIVPAVPPAPPAPVVAAPAVPQPPPAPPAPARQTKPARPPEPARAPEPPMPPDSPRAGLLDAEPVNVRFDVTVSSQTGSAPAVKRSASVTVSNGATNGPTGSGMLRSGNQIPVPTTTFATKSEDGKEAPASRPLTSYSYRSVGLNVDVQNVALLASGRVRASLNIEFSGVDDKSTGATGVPSFPTFSQRLNVFFDSGKPVVVAQSSDFVDNVERKQTVEVKATVLR